MHMMKGAILHPAKGMGEDSTTGHPALLKGVAVLRQRPEKVPQDGVPAHMAKGQQDVQPSDQTVV